LDNLRLQFMVAGPQRERRDADQQCDLEHDGKPG
jgi:hypothetical protein